MPSITACPPTFTRPTLELESLFKIMSPRSLEATIGSHAKQPIYTNSAEYAFNNYLSLEVAFGDSFLAFGAAFIAGSAFFFVLAGFLPVAMAWSPYFFKNLSTRPALSISFCFPVKKG
jgi:hypothetical protein